MITAVRMNAAMHLQEGTVSTVNRSRQRLAIRFT